MKSPVYYFASFFIWLKNRFKKRGKVTTTKTAQAEKIKIENNIKKMFKSEPFLFTYNNRKRTCGRKIQEIKIGNNKSRFIHHN